MTLFFPKRLVLTILFLIGIGGNAICISQENEQIKRLQRTIFIYNFAQQVSWPNALDITTFKIGVLGPDRTVIDLHAMAQKRKIGVLPVEIVRFQKIKDIDGVQLLYVNNDFNFDIGYILTKISNKGILLVTEDYAYNSSMINMVNVGDSFEYEVNRSNLEGAGFKVSSSLFQHAVSDAEKWKELYKASEATRLESEKEQLELLENKESEISPR
ncbi:MAG: YfiR family protein [Bacteroidota bacterium]